MNIKKHIPNFLTCCNLFCGCLGLLNAFYSQNPTTLITSSILIFIACGFDFFDGFVARILNVSSPIGKELDSLADVVTFGVLPGVIIFKLVEFIIVPMPGWAFQNGSHFFTIFKESGTVSHYAIPLPNTMDFSLLHYHPYIEIISFIIPIFSALRLAKFNIDTRQSHSFIGVPTPANAILIASFPIILFQNKYPFLVNILTNPFCLLGIAIIMSILLVAELPLFALKFKNFKWADNQIRFSFLIASFLLIIFFTWTAIPLIIILYILLSIVENKIFKQKSTSNSIPNA